MHNANIFQSVLHLMNMVVLSGALQMYLLLLIFDDGNWRQAEASIVLLAGAVEVNALGPMRATEIHSVAVVRAPNLPVERRTLYH